MKGRLAGLVALVAVLSLAGVALAAEVELPGTPSTSMPQGDRPADAAPEEPPEPEVRTTKKKVPLRTLRLGSRGDYVKDLQKALRKRGLRVKVDGVYGKGTRRAVKIVQKRLKIRSTGVASTGFQRRMGLRPRKTTVTIARPVPVGGVINVFPVARNYAFTDDYGAPRHQGPHQGIDIIAPRGTPIYAVADGVVDRLTRVEQGLGGLYVWQSTGSTEFYYAHLDSVAPGLTEGSKISAGQVIGTVGNTGDARFGVHHLHFEWRPKGVSANPYRHLVAADPNKRPRAASRRN